MQILVDSSDSRTITTAQNFEGLEKGKPGQEDAGAAVEGDQVLTAEEAGQGNGDGGARPTSSSVGSGKGPTRSSSKLEAQLREFEQKKLEEQQKHQDEGELAAAGVPQSPVKSPLSPPRTLVEDAGVKFTEGSGPAGSSPRQLPVQSPGSSSSSSATQV